MLKLIFGTGVFFYTITILTQYGYYSFYNIPSSFIEYSIEDNVILFFDLFRVIRGVLENLSLWLIILLFIVTIVSFIVSLFISNRISKIIVIILIILSAFFAYNLGNKVAQIETEYITIPKECINSSDDSLVYIAPIFYQTKAIITPISKDTNKLNGEFIIKELSEKDCHFKREKIGKINK
jgi:hypothetical protein